MVYEAILKRLKSQTGIHGSSLLTMEGSPIAEDFPDTSTESALISALSATILLTGEKTTMEFRYGSLEHCMMKGNDGKVFLYKVNDRMILTILAPDDVSLGIFTLGIKRAIKDINHFAKRPDL